MKKFISYFGVYFFGALTLLVIAGGKISPTTDEIGFIAGAFGVFTGNGNNLTNLPYHLVAQAQRTIPPCGSLGNQTATGLVCVSNRAYFVYHGRLTRAATFARVKLQVTAGGSGAQNAEIGIFSTPNPPNGTAQTLTRLTVTNSVTDLTTTGIKSNINVFVTPVALIPEGTHIWSALRTGMVTTQPTVVGVVYDFESGSIMIKDNCDLLTTAPNATISGATIPTFSTTQIAPLMRLSLD